MAVGVLIEDGDEQEQEHEHEHEQEDGDAQLWGVRFELEFEAGVEGAGFSRGLGSGGMPG
jgi:hypothetical protein